MALVSLHVFGPSEGFKAFQIDSSGYRDDPSDYLSLSSAEVELAERAEAYRIQMLEHGGRHQVIVSLFRQVFEPNRRRLGHVCGASITITDSAPSSSTIVSILRTTIQNLEAEGCIENGQFCSLSKLDAFARETVPDLRALSSGEFEKSSQPIVAAVLGLGSPKGRFFKSSSPKFLDTDAQSVLHDVLFSLCGSDIAQILVLDTEKSTIISKYPAIPEPEVREAAAIEHIGRLIAVLRDSDGQRSGELNALKNKCNQLYHENVELNQRCVQAETIHRQVKSENDILRQQAQIRQPSNVGLEAGEQVSMSLVRQFNQQVNEIRRDIQIILKKTGLKQEDTIDSILRWVVIFLINSILVLLMSVAAKHFF
jgi:hypothetical protein